MPTTRGESSGESVPVSKTDTALLSAPQGCHQDLVTEHTGNRDKLQRPRQACQGECGLSPAEPPSQHSHPQLSAPLPGFEPTGKECLDGCASSDVRARTSRPAAEMLKGTSLLRKKRKKKRKKNLGENEEQVRASQLAKHDSCTQLCGTPTAMVRFWALPGGLRSPRLLALRALPGAHLFSGTCQPSRATCRDPRAASTNSSQAPAHLVQLPAFPMPRLSPIWPEARFLCRPLSRTQRRTQASRGSFPSKLLPEAPPDPGTISSDPSVL